MSFLVLPHVYLSRDSMNSKFSSSDADCFRFGIAIYVSPATRSLLQPMDPLNFSSTATRHYCPTCSCSMSVKDVPAHVQGKRHQRAQDKTFKDRTMQGRSGLQGRENADWSQNIVNRTPIVEPSEKTYGHYSDDDLSPVSYSSPIADANLDYSICDKDCGWCGQCMGNLPIEYVHLSAPKTFAPLSPSEEISLN